MTSAPRGGGTFGRYLLLEELGQGGMAQIWRARPTDRSRGSHELAVKTLHARLVGQPLFTELFAAEARVTKQLSHPGIIRVVDDGKHKGVPFIAMERVDGWDLAALHRAMPSGRRIPVDIALALTIQLCRAVGFAHDHRDERGRPRPIVHGDLSPSNLMVRRDGGVTVIDFGVAHMKRRFSRGRAHLVIGKSGYLAPELLDDAVANPRTDVFSIGVLLHEMLANRHLFVVDSERETLRRLSELTIGPPSKSNPYVKRDLDDIILRALDRDAERRYPSANDLADALERVETAAAVPERVATFMMQVLGGVAAYHRPVATAPRSSMAATVAARPRHVAPARAAMRRRRTASVATRVLLGVAVLVAAFLVPIPRALPDWLPLAAEAPAPSVAPAPSPSSEPPTVTPPAAPRPQPFAKRHHHRTRSGRR
jgi:serine/threonine-protein kinase